MKSPPQGLSHHCSAPTAGGHAHEGLTPSGLTPGPSARLGGSVKGSALALCFGETRDTLGLKTPRVPSARLECRFFLTVNSRVLPVRRCFLNH